jgi:hypothetical protein
VKDELPLGEPSDTQTNVAEKIAEKISAAAPILPADDCNVLVGISAIARWLGVTAGQAKSLVDDGTVPSFKPPGRTARCALKSAINAAMAEYARRPGACAKSPPRKRSA